MEKESIIQIIIKQQNWEQQRIEDVSGNSQPYFGLNYITERKIMCTQKKQEREKKKEKEKENINIV